MQSWGQRLPVAFKRVSRRLSVTGSSTLGCRSLKGFLTLLGGSFNQTEDLAKKAPQARKVSAGIRFKKKKNKNRGHWSFPSISWRLPLKQSPLVPFLLLEMARKPMPRPDRSLDQSQLLGSGGEFGPKNSRPVSSNRRQKKTHPRICCERGVSIIVEQNQGGLLGQVGLGHTCPTEHCALQKRFTGAWVAPLLKSGTSPDKLVIGRARPDAPLLGPSSKKRQQCQLPVGEFIFSFTHKKNSFTL